MESSEIPGVIAFGIITMLVLWYAGKRQYFTFPSQGEKWNVPVRWHHVATVFTIYFAVITLAVPVFAWAFSSVLSSAPPIALPSWINFVASFTILAAIAIYVLCIPREIVVKIWRRSDQNSYLKDLGFAFLSFIIAFPLVIFINELLDLLLFLVFHVSQLPDQLAVRFLKMTFHYPNYLFLSIITIVVLAPLLEELLFRGFLQSLIRQHLGTKPAIGITALCFAFFHYSPDQGLANVSIMGSLFGLALFLGFVYQRQGSLAASMALHATFNAANVLNLYFLGAFPKTL